MVPGRFIGFGAVIGRVMELHLLPWYRVPHDGMVPRFGGGLAPAAR